MILHIKNMVCDRCKMVVKSELSDWGLHPSQVDLGEVTIEEELDDLQKEDLNRKLLGIGFELIDDRKSRLIEKAKKLIIELVHKHNSKLNTNLSDYLSSELQYDYNSLSNLFSELQGTTIEKYFIAQKIERVKELLVYDEMNLNEIAFMLNYSSVAHLSNQFKKVTGLTPSYFKNIKAGKRKPLDQV